MRSLSLCSLLAVSALSACSGSERPGSDAGEEARADAGSALDAAASAAGADAGAGRDAEADGGPGGGDAAAPGLEVLAVVDLPRGASTTGLSGTYWVAATRTLVAIQDVGPSLTPLAVSEDLRSIVPGTSLALTGRPGAGWDGEAVLRAADEIWAVTVETAPLVERFDLAGRYLGEIPVPAVYAKQAPGNKGLESLALSPSGTYLFTVNESALVVDGAGPTATAGSTLRLLRRELATGYEDARAYRTEPLGPGTGGDMGVAELAALDDTALLVLERGWQSDWGNTVRLFRVDLADPGAGGEDVLASPGLDAATPVLAKTLVVDLGALRIDGVTHPGTQANALLDNYEGLAVGPVLSDGRRVLFVTSDDNANLATQVARVLVLAVPGL